MDVFSYHGASSDMRSISGSEKDLSVLEKTHGPFHEVAVCPFCSDRITWWSNSWTKGPYPIDGIIGYVAGIKVCSNCGWWRDFLTTINQSDTFMSIALLSKSDVSADDAPLDELHRYIATNWSATKHISAKRAEDLVAKVFREHMDCAVHYFPDSVYSPDKGIDFVLVENQSGICHAFQVKRRQNDRPETAPAVRSFIGAVALSPYRKGFYVTTADRFTRNAEQELRQGRKRLAEKSIEIVLVDGTKLHELLMGSIPKARSLEELAGRYATNPDSWELVEPGSGEGAGRSSGTKGLSLRAALGLN